MKKVLASVMEWLPAMGIVVTILVGWEIFVRVWNIADWLLPAPSAIGYTLYDSSGLLAGHTLVTLEEIVLGFVLALISGMLLASAIHYLKRLKKLYTHLLLPPKLFQLLL